MSGSVYQYEPENILVSNLKEEILLSSKEFDWVSCGHVAPSNGQHLLPELSSPYFPQKTMPNNCSHPLVEKYIRGIEAGLFSFETLEPDESVQDKRTKTMDSTGNIIESNGNPLESAVGYVWKQLCDHPIVIGVTQGVDSDHDPHYHLEPECYYVISGKAKTLCNDQYIDLQRGDYFFIPGNTIHNTPILPTAATATTVTTTETETETGGVSTGPTPFSVLYWFPMNHTFSSFEYRWKRNSTDCEVIDRFRKIDHIRERDLRLEPYGTGSGIAPTFVKELK
jgi:mannose-6-phosphate isomerase-like protein (cupin superfamily)